MSRKTGRYLTGSATLILCGAMLFVTMRHQDAFDSRDGQRSEQGQTLTADVSEGAAITTDRAAPAQRLEVDCAVLMTTIEGSPELARFRRDLEIDLFLRDQGFGWLERELVMDLAGYREQRAALAFKRNHPIETSPPLSNDRRRRLGDTLQRAGVLRYFGTGWHSEIPVPELTFGHHEAARAIKHGVSAEALMELIDASGIDPTVVSRYGAASLVRTAAMHGRPDLVRFLLERGVDPTRKRGSVLDDLPFAWEQNSRRVMYAEVIGLLSAAGDRPYLPSTLKEITKAMPDYVSVPRLHAASAMAIQTPQVRDAADGLTELVAAWEAKLDDAASVERRCRDWLNVANERNPLGRHGRNESKFADPKMLEQAKGLLALAEEQIKAGNVPEETKAFVRMLDLWSAGLWKDAFAVADEWDLGYEELLVQSLKHGAPFEVVMEVVRRNGGRIPQDAILHLAYSPWSGATEVAETLVAVYGMDSHFVSPDGRSAYDELVEQFYNLKGPNNIGQPEPAGWAMAQFLARQGVAAVPSGSGSDPLHRVLRNALEFPFTVPAAVAYARLLVDQGAPVGSTHRKFAAWLAEVNREGYQQLVEAVPELAVDT